MKYYIDVDITTNIIKDIITYPYSDYIEIDIPKLDYPIHAGFYRYINGEIILDEALRDEILSQIIEE